MRGESGRVAARVSELLRSYGAHDGGEAPEPASPPTLGLDAGRRRTLAVGAAAVVVAIIAGVWLVHRQPAPPAAALPTGTSTNAPPATAGSASAPMSASAAAPVSSASAPPGVMVDVAGKVRRPGVYRLPAGARVIDALHAAGGARPGVNLNSLDLAARVVDGQQVAVGVRGAVGAGAVPPAGAPGSGASGGVVDLNSATLEQLETLPGVGPVLGQRILDWRAQHGRFASIGQLKDVSGIGDARFADLQPHVTV